MPIVSTKPYIWNSGQRFKENHQMTRRGLGPNSLFIIVGFQLRDQDVGRLWPGFLPHDQPPEPLVHPQPVARQHHGRRQEQERRGSVRETIMK